MSLFNLNGEFGEQRSHDKLSRFDVGIDVDAAGEAGPLFGRAPRQNLTRGDCRRHRIVCKYELVKSL